MTNKINKDKDEVDLLDLFYVVLDKKILVLSITIISIFIGIIFKLLDNGQKIYEIKTQIKPITVTEDSRYKSYNSYIASIKPIDIGKFSSINTYSDDYKLEISNKILKSNIIRNDLEIQDIDKVFLFDLFIDKISQRKNLEKYLTQSKFTKLNIDQEENLLKAFVDLSSPSKTNLKKESDILDIDPINIKFLTKDIDLAKKFLKILEKEVNIEIQNNIRAMFENNIRYAESIANFQLEDTDSQLSIVKDEREIYFLEELKKVLLSDKYISRLKNAFEQSPMLISDEFYAAKIIYEAPDLKDAKYSMKKILILFGIFGLILGIIIALIYKGIELRKVN